MNGDKDHDSLTPAGLDDLFAELRLAPTAMPDGLMARVLADADRLQPVAPVIAPRRASLQGGWAAAFSALFGGGASLAGLAVAGAAGIWIGFAQPFDIDFGLGLQAATLESINFYPAELDQWSEALAPELLSDN